MKLIKVVKATYYIFCFLFFISAFVMVMSEGVIDIYSRIPILEIILGVTAVTGILLAGYDIWNNWGEL